MLLVFVCLLAIAVVECADESSENASHVSQDAVAVNLSLEKQADLKALTSGPFLAKSNEHPDLTKAQDTDFLEAKGAAYRLEFGYVPRASEPSFLATTKPIFQLDADDMTVSSHPRPGVERKTSNNLKSTTTKLTAELGIDATYIDAFTASVSASASSITSTNTKTYRVDLFIKAIQLEAFINAAYPYKKMRPDVRTFFLQESIERIVRDYGEFFVTKATLGGLIRGTVIKTLTSREDEDACEVQFSVATGVLTTLAVQGNAALSAEEQKNFELCQSDWEGVGGQTNLWFQMSNPEKFDDTLQEWRDTVEPGHLGILFYEGLKPIWELLDADDMNRTKARELRSYLTERWTQSAHSAFAQELLRDGYLPTPTPTRRPAPSPPAPSRRRRSVVKQGDYMLKNADEKYLNADCWWNCDHETNLNLYSDSSSWRDNRIFEFEHHGSGVHSLRSKRGDLYVGQFHGSVKLASSSFKGRSAAKWIITCNNDNVNDCSLQNLYSHECLAPVPHSGLLSHPDVATNYCSKSSARWILIRPR